MNSLPAASQAHTDEDKRVLYKKILARFVAYWIGLFAFIVIAGETDSHALSLMALAALTVVNVMLAMSVAEAASTGGGSRLVWGAGVFFLGPVGALFLGTTQLVKLQRYNKARNHA